MQETSTDVKKLVDQHVDLKTHGILRLNLSILIGLSNILTLNRYVTVPECVSASRLVTKK
ncbi:MAG: hypothetical protein OXD43_05835 [Bacteroidetes bacterium]|nr:hypothetical protein [Bacteroidota bacterium]